MIFGLLPTVSACLNHGIREAEPGRVDRNLKEWYSVRYRGMERIARE